MAQIEGVGSHLIWGAYEGTVTAGVSRTLDDQITDADARVVAAREDLFTGVTPLVELQGTVSVLSHAANVAVLGTTPNYRTVRKNVSILRGRFLDEEDIVGRAKVCVVSRTLYEELFGNDASSEKVIRTLGMNFVVVGEFEKPVDTMGQGEVTPRSIFIPITVAWFFTPTRRVDTLFAEVRDFSAIPRAAETMEEILRDRHHQGSVFRVKTMTTVDQGGPRHFLRTDRRLHPGGGRLGHRRGRRDHEHPARFGRAAHARDRPAQVGRRPPPGHPPAVPARRR